MIQHAWLGEFPISTVVEGEVRDPVPMTSRLDSGVEVRRVLNGTSGLGSHSQPTPPAIPTGALSAISPIIQMLLLRTLWCRFKGAPMLSESCLQYCLGCPSSGLGARQRCRKVAFIVVSAARRQV